MVVVVAGVVSSPPSHPAPGDAITSKTRGVTKVLRGRISTSYIVLFRCVSLPKNTVASGVQGRLEARLFTVAFFARHFPKIDFWLFHAFSIACVLIAARTFYGYMLLQTGGEWSAPLDDVFIHFDYARAIARGYPFQWSEGNGFSSGNTSISYPFVLAFGYWIGFRGLLLMKWAAYVACFSVFVFIAMTARLFQPFGRWAKYLLPPFVLSVGALDWSLFSGMENAFHLCTWGLSLRATCLLVRAAELGKPLIKWALLAGFASALLFLTRPESVVSVGALSAWALLRLREKAPDKRFPLRVTVALGAPFAVAFVGQMVANRVFTGEWAAAGAIAKLTINHPYLTPSDKWSEYGRFLKHVVLRNTHRHLGEFNAEHPIPWGWLVPLTALFPLFSKHVRGIAIALWAQVIGWLLLVSMNGQVVWQNERYTMSAVAWLLVLSAMGIAVLLSGAFRRTTVPSKSDRQRLLGFAMRLSLALAIVGFYYSGQMPRMRDQIWFFGRASRNIRDQHIVAGLLLARMKPERVLVGDAGALIYASDRPGMDLIGLGGYGDLPFARAGVLGLGASLELIERLPPEARPDVMALYPSWWGDLPLIFGKRVMGVPVFGNVICGGSEKVIYLANWAPLERHSRPRFLSESERIVDEVDIADLVSERRHHYEYPHPAAGFVDFRVLREPPDIPPKNKNASDPKFPAPDLFDAGRVIAPGQAEVMYIHIGNGAHRLVIRSSPETKATLNVELNGVSAGRLVFPGPAIQKRQKPEAAAWVELSFPLPKGLMGEVQLRLTVKDGGFFNAHVWVIAEF